jgi:hypothetical protein
MSTSAALSKSAVVVIDLANAWARQLQALVRLHDAAPTVSMNRGGDSASGS